MTEQVLCSIDEIKMFLKKLFTPDIDMFWNIEILLFLVVFLIFFGVWI